jgi:hypothetical protein
MAVSEDGAAILAVADGRLNRGWLLNRRPLRQLVNCLRLLLPMNRVLIVSHFLKITKQSISGLLPSQP